MKRSPARNSVSPFREASSGGHELVDLAHGLRVEPFREAEILQLVRRARHPVPVDVARYGLRALLLPSLRRPPSNLRASRRFALHSPVAMPVWKGTARIAAQSVRYRTQGRLLSMRFALSPPPTKTRLRWRRASRTSGVALRHGGALKSEQRRSVAALAEQPAKSARHHCVARSQRPW